MTLPQEAQWLPPLCPFEQQEASRDASETSLCCPVAPFLSLISVYPQIVQVLRVYPSETQVGGEGVRYKGMVCAGGVIAFAEGESVGGSIAFGLAALCACYDKSVNGFNAAEGVVGVGG